MTAADPTPDLAAAVTRLREQAEVCERHDTGDGWMETPIEAARQMGADLRVVLGALEGDRRLANIRSEVIALREGQYEDTPAHRLLGRVLRKIDEVAS